MESETKLTEVSDTGAVTSSENEEKNKKEKENQNTAEKDKTTNNMDKPGVREQSDNEDSEIDDYNLTEDQKRALEELDNLKTEMGYPDEDPPEYDVTERLKILNEDLKKDPTPLEKQKESKVGFKQNLVDLVAPPPDFSDDEGDKQNSPKNKNKTPQKQSEEKEDEKSETISNSKQSNGAKKDEVLIEIDGQFQLVSADDVRARDLGYVMDSDKNKENEKKVNKENKENKESNKTKGKMQPSPPGKPRPATAQVNSRRNVRPTSSSSSGRQRPQSASASSTNHGSPLTNFDYSSPYALSPREKQLMEERKKALEKEKQEKDRQKKKENEDKERENQEAFEYWLKKKRESDRRKRIQDEDDRKKNDKEDRPTNIKSLHTLSSEDVQLDTSIDYSDSDEKAENEEAFKGWLKEKHSQFKKEKLLKRRQEQEMNEGYYVRSREDCEKAYKQWLKQKAIEARKARAAERQKAKLQRLAARRARKGISLSKSIQEAQSFRYVDYYGYRF